MNRHLRQTFLAYLLTLLITLVYVPWYGHPQEPWTLTPCVRYAPAWNPPQTIGYSFSFDTGRLLLEIISLSVVMVSAALSLRGEKRSGAADPDTRRF
jgi:hypothetical protein